MHVKEEEMSLYGFLTREDKEMFFSSADSGVYNGRADRLHQ